MEIDVEKFKAMSYLDKKAECQRYISRGVLQLGYDEAMTEHYFMYMMGELIPRPVHADGPQAGWAT